MHNTFGHHTNTCVRFRDTIQKAIEEGRLIFEEKPKMKVDENPFHVAANFAEPEYDVNMVNAAIHQEALVVEAVFPEEETVDHVIEKFKDETSNKIYPDDEETLSEFLHKKCSFNQKVMLCPRCSSVFDKATAKAFERSNIKKEFDTSEAKKEVANEDKTWRNQHDKKGTRFFDRKKKRSTQKRR
ncbi:hypothetical protein A2U01_0000457 [Trifolium medium]|uniref:Uncharacterized protein n=1 Tax=Trifolium medium TaxID=97028 RepID=A0A392LXM6_9FABA|nr:hypothetical protein [Trifolium medium]